MRSYNYTKIKREAPIVKQLPKQGTWLPVTAAASQTGWSGQMIRYLFFKKLVDGIRLEGSGLLVNIEQIAKLVKKTWKKGPKNPRSK